MNGTKSGSSPRRHATLLLTSRFYLHQCPRSKQCRGSFLTSCFFTRCIRWALCQSNIPPLSTTNNDSSSFSSTVVCSVVRFCYLLERLHKPKPEILHYSVMAVTWSLIEVNISVIAVNMPTLMPILDWCLVKKKRSPTIWPKPHVQMMRSTACF